jgi:hypothetical protein
MSRGKYWCWTLNNPTEEEVGSIKDPTEDVTYICFGREIAPGTGTPHLQGYVEFRRKFRIGGIKQLNGFGRMHLERRKGTQEEAIEYCRKDGEFEEYGTRTVTQQGRRSDLEAIKRKLDDGMSMADIADQHFGDFIRYGKGLQRYVNLKKPRYREVVVYCLWGHSGVGKTRSVYEREENLFICPDSKLQWFDGYQGEPAVLIDDFRGTERSGFLLQLLDRYPLRVPVKGDFVAWAPERIYITSNIAPPFGMMEIDIPLCRRIHKTIEIQEPLTFPMDLERFFAIN